MRGPRYQAPRVISVGLAREDSRDALRRGVGLGVSTVRDVSAYVACVLGVR